ncbi:MAG TPA: septal ring lytic transglycosylase RlpA family protein [Bacteroidia bacterium]|nr:septal ring lytic transglycosylase RlpA family protein [Bacteroidia bacterium]
MRAFLIITLLLGFRYTISAQDALSVGNKTTGTASFYAKKFNGRKTSSGEKFSSDSLTAAHKKLKFGTYVLVRNLKNDSTVVVKINDRLPQKSKRSIDLTLRAAKQLNFVKSGLTKVEITVLDSLKK